MPPARALLLCLSGAALLLAGRSLWLGPPPAWFAVMALAVYLVVVVTGVLVPSFEMFGEVVFRGSSEKAWVALTFDDGPHPTTTRAVLDLLDAYAVKATFFVIGTKVDAHPDLVQRMRASGHALGLHGFAHDRLLSLRSPSFIARDIERTQTAVERAGGGKVRFFRPPLGHVSPRTVLAAKRAGVMLVGWSVRGFDGLRGTRAAGVTQRVLAGLRPGAIVLLHDAAEKGDFVPASLTVLPAILDEIKARGLVCVTLDEMLEDGAIERPD